MKQLVRGALIALSITFLAGLIFYYSQRYSVLVSDPSDAISGDAVIVLEFKGGKNLFEKISKSSAWKAMDDDPAIAGTTDDLKRLDSVFSLDETAARLWNESNCILSWHPSGNRSGAWLLCTNLPQGMNSNSAVSIMTTIAGPKDWTVREYEDVKIHESAQGKGFCYYVSKGIFACSRSAVVLENSIRHLSKGVPLRSQEAFNSIRKRPESSGDLKMYIDLPALREYWSGRITERGKRFADMIARTGTWIGGELALENTSIGLDGTTTVAETSDLLAILRPSNTESSLLRWLPEQTAWMVWFPFEQGTTWKRLQANKSFFLVPQSRQAELDSLKKSLESGIPKQLLDSASGEFCLFITEALTPELENNIFLALHLKDPSGFKRFITSTGKASKKSPSDSFQDATIELADKNITPVWFGEIARGIHRTAVAISGNTIVFGNQAAALSSMIQKKKNENRLFANPVFRNTVIGAGKDAVLMTYATMSRSRQLLHAIFDSTTAHALTDSASWSSRFESVSTVFTKKGKEIHANIKLNLSTGALVPAALSWATRLDTLLTTRPQVVQLGERSDEPNILIQDLRNTLYFISPSGTIRLKKPLPDPIIGGIGTVDLYGNGASQLIFTTRKQLWVVDAEGNNVGAFPIRLPSDCAGPCSFLKNSNGKAERCFIPCDNGVIYAFEKDGRPIANWQQRPGFDSLASPLLLINDSTDNRIAVHDKYGIKLINANGKYIKLATEEPIATMTGLIADSGRSTTAYIRTKNGKVARIDFSKRKIDFILSEDSIIDLTCTRTGSGKTRLITVDTSGIQVRSTDGALQQIISSPFKNKVMIQGNTEESINFWGLLNPKENQMAAFDLNGMLLPGFPVAGGIGYDVIRNQKDDSSIGIVVTSMDGTILLYAVQR